MLNNLPRNRSEAGRVVSGRGWGMGLAAAWGILLGAYLCFDLGAATHGWLGVPLFLGGLVLAVWVYLYPARVAQERGHPDAEAIRTLNLCLGWTFLGWVVALVWAQKNFSPR